jgi:hypothetical protein
VRCSGLSLFYSIWLIYSIQTLAQTHFPPSINYELQDFFTPISISSESRARAFLWLCFHYYEGTSPNPYDDGYSEQHSGMIPRLYSLSPEEARLENVDTPDEKAWGEKMTAQRALFMENKDKPLAAMDMINAIGEGETSVPKQKTARRGRGGGQSKGRGGKDTEPASSRTLARKSSTPKQGRTPGDSSFHAASPAHSKREKSSEGMFLSYVYVWRSLMKNFKGSSRGLHCADSLQPLPASPDMDDLLSPIALPFTSPLVIPPHVEPARRSAMHHKSPRPSPLTNEPYPSRKIANTNAHPESTSGGPVRRNRRSYKAGARLDTSAVPSIDSMESYSPQSARHPSIILSQYSQTDTQPSHSHLIPVSYRQSTSVIPLHTYSSSAQPRTMLERTYSWLPRNEKKKKSGSSFIYRGLACRHVNRPPRRFRGRAGRERPSRSV